MDPKLIAVLCLSIAATAPARAQEITSEPGPLERSAKPVTPENPIPRWIFSVPPSYPPEAAAIDAAATVSLRVTLAPGGRIGEIRRLNNPFVKPPGTPATPARLQSAGEAMVASAISAVSRWQYDAPADGPLSFTVSFAFEPGAETTSAQDGRPAPGGAAGRTPAVFPAPPWPAAEGAVRVGGNVRAPMQMRRVAPVYPPDARADGVQGAVIMEALIGEDGRVRDVRVLRSIPRLDQAAVDAVKQWEYQPMLLNGAAVPIVMTVTVQFTLKSEVGK